MGHPQSADPGRHVARQPTHPTTQTHRLEALGPILARLTKTYAFGDLSYQKLCVSGSELPKAMHFGIFLSPCWHARSGTFLKKPADLGKGKGEEGKGEREGEGKGRERDKEGRRRVNGSPSARVTAQGRTWRLAPSCTRNRKQPPSPDR